VAQEPSEQRIGLKKLQAEEWKPAQFDLQTPSEHFLSVSLGQG
jgi:hypothetical protein